MDLRPKNFEEFVNQQSAKTVLLQAIQSAKIRHTLPDHILFYGLPGIGKTTLAYIIAKELKLGLVPVTGGSLKEDKELLRLLAKAERKILFIDEIHRMKKPVQENLYSILEDSVVKMYGTTVTYDRTLFIGATTEPSKLTKPLRDRFPIHIRLTIYPIPELREIGLRTAEKLNMLLEESGLEVLVKQARGTPRILNNFLLRLRDYAVVTKATLNEESVSQFMQCLPEKYDKYGLTEVDRQILLTLFNSATALGVRNLSFSVNEEPDMVENFYEPYLLSNGYIIRTPRGRKITKKGIEVLGEHYETKE